MLNKCISADIIQTSSHVPSTLSTLSRLIFLFIRVWKFFHISERRFFLKKQMFMSTDTVYTLNMLTRSRHVHVIYLKAISNENSFCLYLKYFGVELVFNSQILSTYCELNYLMQIFRIFKQIHFALQVIQVFFNNNIMVFITINIYLFCSNQLRDRFFSLTYFAEPSSKTSSENIEIVPLENHSLQTEFWDLLCKSKCVIVLK